MRSGPGIRSAVRRALAIVSSLTLLAGIIGWVGLSLTEARLQQHQVQSLSDVGQITSLVGRSVSLATEAAKIGYLDSLETLETARSRFSNQMQEFVSLAADLPRPATNDAFHLSDVPAIVRLVRRLDGMTQNLFTVTSELVSVRRNLSDRRRTLEALLGISSTGEQALAALRTVEQVMSEEDIVRAFALREQFERTASPSSASTQLLSDIFALRIEQISAMKRADFTMVMIDIAFGQLTTTVEGLSALVETSAVERGVELLDMTQLLKLAMLGGALICLVAGLLVSAVFTRAILRSLIGATDALRRLASGDNQAELPGEARVDEIGDLSRAFRVFKANAMEREALVRQVEQDAQLRLGILNALDEGVALFDIGGNLLAWNPRFVALSGLQSGSARITLADLSLVLGTSEAWVSGGSPSRSEHHFEDGRTIEARIGTMPKGGYLVTLVDLTDRKEMERRLIQSQQMEAVGRLTGGIAHDFNNLLAAVSSNLQLISDQADIGSVARRRAERAMGAVESGASMTQRLLAFARQQPLQPETTDLNEIVRGLVDLVELSLDPTISLETRLASDRMPVIIDPSQMEAAVLNLVFNARDAMPSGGTITISTRKIEPMGVELVVADTGEGMAPDVARKAFDPFFTTKAFGAGSGLGLSTVFGFIKQTGGQIRIDTKPGLGTRMRIELPMVSGASGGRSKPKRRGRIATCGEGSVLLVEDDDILRETTVDMLSSMGYEVAATSSSAGALSRLRRQRFDIIFSDIVLGTGDDGVALATAALELQPHLGVVLCTGYAGRAEAAVEGMDVTVLQKPYGKNDLATALATARQADTTSTSAAKV